jgi:ankyrin repeat protein
MKLLLATLAATLLLLVGCGMSEEEARQKLADLNEEYTVENFVSRAASGDRTAVNLFLRSGMNSKLSEALVKAAKGGHSETVDLLLEAGAKVEKGVAPVAALAGAAAKGNEQNIKLLLKAGVSPSEEALIAAAQNGRRAVVELLSEEGAEIKEDSRSAKSALLEAVSNENAKTVALLREAGASLEGGYDLAELELLQSSSFGDVKKVRLFLKAGLPPLENGEALSRAATEGHSEIVRLLMEAGGKLSASSEQAEQELVSSARQGEEEQVRLLTKAGATLEGPSKEANQALIESAREGDSTSVELLLEVGTDPSATVQRGETPLMWASVGGHIGTAKMLYNAGADPRAEDVDGNTALALAAENNLAELVETFSEPRRSGAGNTAAATTDTSGPSDSSRAGNRDAQATETSGANARDSENESQTGKAGSDRSETALVAAAQKGNVEKVRLLLKAEVSPGALGPEGNSALSHAASQGHLEVAQVLLEAGATDKKNALLRAASGGHAETVELLTGAGADPNAKNTKGQPVLALAANQENLQVAKLLAGAGATLKASGEASAAALLDAAKRGGVEMATLLVEAGANLSGNSEDASRTLLKAFEGNLRTPTQGGKHSVAELLIRAGARLKGNDGSERALAYAAARGDVDAVRLFKKAGTSLEGSPPEATDALKDAVENSNTKVIELLVEAGLSPNAKMEGGTPLGYIIFNYRRDWKGIESPMQSVRTLIKVGADPGVTRRDRGVTPLGSAAQLDDQEMLRTLLEAVSNPSKTNALWKATVSGQAENVRMLLEAGCSPNTEGPNGHSALQWAEQNGISEEITRVLRNSAKK